MEERQDLISRQAAIDAMKEKRNSAKEWYEEASASGDEMMLSRAESAMMTFVECILTIKKLPPAQPERKKGKWTKDCACEICGFKPWYERDIHTLSFCPNCGADMREDNNG